MDSKTDYECESEWDSSTDSERASFRQTPQFLCESTTSVLPLLVDTYKQLFGSVQEVCQPCSRSQLGALQALPSTHLWCSTTPLRINSALSGNYLGLIVEYAESHQGVLWAFYGRPHGMCVCGLKRVVLASPRNLWGVPPGVLSDSCRAPFESRTTAYSRLNLWVLCADCKKTLGHPQ